MEKFLYRRGIRGLPARSGTRRGSLARACEWAVCGYCREKYPFGAATAIATACIFLAAIITRDANAQSLKRGEDLLTRNCATCHAIGRIGESPHKSAPPFRVLGQRYPIESLEEALGEGIMSGHPDMPEFSFDAGDVGAIIAYLKSIQQR